VTNFILGMTQNGKNYTADQLQGVRAPTSEANSMFSANRSCLVVSNRSRQLSPRSHVLRPGSRVPTCCPDPDPRDWI
jgi:hypothetical protein